MSWATAKAIVVHDIDQARAVLATARELALPVTLISDPGAANNVGVGYFATLIRLSKAEFPDVTAYGVLDCGQAGGRALAALRSGLDAIIYTADGPSFLRLADIAEDLGVGMSDERPKALELLDAPDYESACRTWLSA